MNETTGECHTKEKALSQARDQAGSPETGGGGAGGLQKYGNYRADHGLYHHHRRVFDGRILRARHRKWRSVQRCAWRVQSSSRSSESYPLMAESLQVGNSQDSSERSARSGSESPT